MCVCVCGVNTHVGSFAMNNNVKLGKEHLHLNILYRLRFISAEILNLKCLFYFPYIYVVMIVRQIL